MNSQDEIFISETESLCPVCLRKIKAEKVKIGDEIYLRKICPEHGEFKIIIWRGEPNYLSWNIETENTPPKTLLSDENLGCPFDCGVCPEHQQQACCVLVEVTKRCNQNCTFCYAGSGHNDVDPSLEQIRDWFKYLIEIGEKRPFNIQLSGGEPTVRDDLPEIIKMGREMGIPYIQLNTNGLRLAEDSNYVKQLKDAGLSVVFLQFDGTTQSIYQKIRGKDLLDKKMKAIKNCSEHQLGVVLVPTLVKGVNSDNIGAIIRLAIENLPAVRGVHFQPVSYFGKYPEIPDNSDRITLPEVMSYIENQTDGKIRTKDLKPLKSGCPYCSFTGSFVYTEDGEIVSTTKGDNCCCKCNTENSEIMKARDFVLNKWVLKEPTKIQAKASQYDFSLWDDYINRVQNYGFSITCMAFQDVWNVDIERLKKCTIHIFNEDKKELIPFCAFNLTDTAGKALYRR